MDSWGRVATAGVVALALALPAQVAGQAAPAVEGDVKARGERLFTEASSAYNLGKFDEAIVKFEAAYELLQAPSLLYNLGQAHVRAHEIDGDPAHLRRARALYDNFIKIRENGGESVGDARERMAAVDARLAEVAPEPEPEPEPAPQAAPEPAPQVEPAPAPKIEAKPGRRGPGGLGYAGIGLIAGGVLAGTGLAVPGFVSASRLTAQEADEGAVVPVSAARQAVFADSLGKAHALAYAGLAVGGALVVTGVVLVIVDARRGRRAGARARLRPRAGGLAVAF
jgi:tetratricopeptide (TPR) repeat protein